MVPESGETDSPICRQHGRDRGRRDAAGEFTHRGADRVHLRSLGWHVGHRRGRASSGSAAGTSAGARRGHTGQPPAAPAQPAPFLHFNNQTLRQIVRTSIGGNRARVAIANTFGTAPLTIGAAHIALRAKESAIAPESDRALTFSGRPTITIPSGAVVYSDPVDLNVPALADVAVDLYLPGNTNTASPVTMHNGARQTSYVSQTGNHVGIAALPVVATTQSWFFLTRVEVTAPEQAGAIVAFGDSITDGSASTADTNRRWPNRLAERLMAQPGTVKMAVLNAGIGGNRVLSEGNFNAGINALARFERDALGQSGVTHVIVLEGINDISNARQNPTPTAEDIIAIHRQMIDRAHTRGIKIIGATLTPNEGCTCSTKEGEAKRQAINQWIRTGGAYDGVIDFDTITRDPAQPADSCPGTTPGTICIRATRAIRRWGTASI